MPNRDLNPDFQNQNLAFLQPKRSAVELPPSRLEIETGEGDLATKGNFLEVFIEEREIDGLQVLEVESPVLVSRRVFSVEEIIIH